MVKVDDVTDIDKAYDDLGSKSLHNAEASPDGSHDNIPSYDRSSDGLDAMENQFGNDGVKDAESGTSGSWANNVKSRAAGAATDKAIQAGLASTGVGAAAAPFVSKVLNKLPLGLRKKAAAPLLVAMLLFGGGAILSISGPAMLLQQIMEVVGAKFDTQRVVVRSANKRLLRNATEEITAKRLCGLKICDKMKTLSKRQQNKYAKYGITVTGHSKLGGRIKPTSFEYKGKTIPASNFVSEMSKDPDLAKDVMRANSWRYAFSDRIFRSAGKLYRWSKRAPFTKADNDKDAKKDIEKKQKKLKSIAEGTDSRTTILSSKQKEVCNGDAACEERNRKIDQENSGRDKVNSAVEDVKQNAAKATPGGVKKLTGALTISGTVGGVCAIGDMMSAITTGAKVLRFAQLAPYALAFLTVASQIRAGDATPEAVSGLGNILTKTVNRNGKTTKSATDGFFYRNAAFGDKIPTETSSNFALGWSGGAIMNWLRNFSETKACKIANNVITQSVEIGLSVVAAIFSGGGSAAGQAASIAALKVALQQAMKGIAKGFLAGLALDELVDYITPMVINTAAGIVLDDTTFGEDAGDALVSGSSAMMSRTGSSAGGAPLTATQAKSFNTQKMKAVRIAAAQEDQNSLSPLDTSSPYTALGAIVNQFSPYMSSFGSAAGSVSAIGAMSLSSVANIALPATYAIEEEDFACDDAGLEEIGVGCHKTLAPTTGLPEAVMNDYEKGIPGATLDDIANRLRNHTVWFEANRSKAPGICERNRAEVWNRNPFDGPAIATCHDPLITEDGQIESPRSLIYENFIARCILRTNPFSIETDDEGDGRDCKVNDTATWNSDYSFMRMEDELKYKSGASGLKLPNQMKVDMYLWWQAMRSFCVDTFGYDNIEGDNTEDKPCQSEFYDSKYITLNGILRTGPPFMPATGETGPSNNTIGSNVSGTSGAGNGSTVAAATPEMCKSLPANDQAQIACHAYQFTNTRYKWGGGHSGTAAQFMADFKAGKYPPGSETVDCSGLVRMTIYETYGVDIGGIGSDDYFGTGHFEKVPVEDAKPGDLIIILGKHVEIVVKNKPETKTFDTIGAHSARLPIGQSIGPTTSGYSYGSASYILRWKG